MTADSNTAQSSGPQKPEQLAAPPPDDPIESARSEIRRVIRADGLKLPKSLKRRSTFRISCNAGKPFVLLLVPLLLARFQILAALLLALPFFLAAQRSFQTIVHDTSHRFFSEKVATNNLLGDFFAAGWIGSNIAAYKDVHMRHHRYNGSKLDPEYIDFEVIKQRGGLARFILRYAVGGEALRLFRKYYAPAKVETQSQPSQHDSSNAASAAETVTLSTNPAGEGLRTSKLRKLAPIFVAQTTMLVLCVLSGGWYFYGAWMYLLLSWTPMLSGLRFLVEHPGRSDRTITTPSWLLERSYFAPQSFNHHFEHHAWPTIPPYRLKAAYRYLVNQGFYERHPEYLGTTFIQGLKARTA